jgi:hypothetical protein
VVAKVGAKVGGGLAGAGSSLRSRFPRIDCILSDWIFYGDRGCSACEK